MNSDRRELRQSVVGIAHFPMFAKPQDGTLWKLHQIKVSYIYITVLYHHEKVKNRCFIPQVLKEAILSLMDRSWKIRHRFYF